MNMYKVNLLYAYYGKLNILLICFYFHVLFYAAQFYNRGFCFASMTLLISLFLFQNFKMIICLFLIIVLHITVPFIKKNLSKL